LEDRERSSLAERAECLPSADPARIAPLRNFAVVTANLNMSDGRSTSVIAVIDSGAPRSFINAKAAEVLALSDADFVGKGATAAGLNAAQTTTARRLRMPQTTFGSWNLSDLELLLFDFPVFKVMGYDSRPAMIVGMDILAKRAFSIDRNGQGFCLLEMTTIR
jgi:hypothetical protein